MARPPRKHLMPCSRCSNHTRYQAWITRGRVVRIREHSLSLEFSPSGLDQGMAMTFGETVEVAVLRFYVQQLLWAQSLTATILIKGFVRSWPDYFAQVADPRREILDISRGQILR